MILTNFCQEFASALNVWTTLNGYDQPQLGHTFTAMGPGATFELKPFHSWWSCAIGVVVCSCCVWVKAWTVDCLPSLISSCLPAMDLPDIAWPDPDVQVDFPARPWTCLLTTNLPGDLDSMLSVVIISGPVLLSLLRLKDWVLVCECPCPTGHLMTHLPSFKK